MRFIHRIAHERLIQCAGAAENLFLRAGSIKKAASDACAIGEVQRQWSQSTRRQPLRRLERRFIANLH